MSWFARIEEGCAAFIERAFANMFPSSVEPAHIARKLVATMEARTHQADGIVSAPAKYTVCVSPGDFAQLLEHRDYLEREWSALLDDVAGRVGIRLEGGAAVQLKAQDRVPPGAIEIHAERGEDQEAPAQFVLRMVTGPGSPAECSVNGATRVGRSPQCDIVLADPSVSRSHALLDVRGGALTVQDAASTNGTYVNGVRVQSSSLKAGDIVSFGRTSMRVEASGA